MFTFQSTCLNVLIIQIGDFKHFKSPPPKKKREKIKWKNKGGLQEYFSYKNILWSFQKIYKKKNYSSENTAKCF